MYGGRLWRGVGDESELWVCERSIRGNSGALLSMSWEFIFRIFLAMGSWGRAQDLSLHY